MRRRLFMDKGFTSWGMFDLGAVSQSIMLAATERGLATMPAVELALQGHAGDLGIFAVILVPLTVIVLALIGLHPLISIAIFGQILMALHLPLPVLAIALCLNIGGSIAYMVSPFAGIILTISKFIDAKATDIAIRWNWLFCLIYFVYGITAAYIIGSLFPSL